MQPITTSVVTIQSPALIPSLSLRGLGALRGKTRRAPICSAQLPLIPKTLMDKPSDVGVARQDAKFAKNWREGVARESSEYGE